MASRVSAQRLQRGVWGKFRRIRVSRRAAIVLGALGVIFAAILLAAPPVMIGSMIDGHVDFSTVYTAEEFGLVADKVTLETTDGVRLVAYDVYHPEPKAVVIFISGIQNPSVTAFFGHARMLQEHGYASVLYEMRAHGESEGDVVGLGYKEWMDTRAVVDYIIGQERYEGVPIVVFGLSMGGAVAINSIANIPEIDGLVALSAYSSFADVFADQMVRLGAGWVLATVERAVAWTYLALKFGWESRDMTPIIQIEKLGDRPALLIHSTDDTQVPYPSFTRLVKRAPGHVETWTRSGDLHMITSDFLDPRNDREYAERILEFLERHFGGRSASIQ